MTWREHHRRCDVLRAVIAAADERLDGRVPMDVPGVEETFGDEATLVAALQLRWYTCLAGLIEVELADEPLDLAEAVAIAWRRSADELPGIRAVLDRVEDEITIHERGFDNEHTLLAVMAGRCAQGDLAAPRLGRELEDLARETVLPEDVVEQAPSLLMRLKALVA